MNKTVATILGILLTFSGGIYYYKYTQNKIDILTKNITKYQLITEQNEITIQSLKNSAKENQDRITELNVNLVISEKSNDELRAKLQKHDLEAIALKKPKLLEKRINDASNKIIDDLNTITKY